MEVEGYERKKHENYFNYTDDQLMEKNLALKNMADLYPTVPAFYREMVYDMCKNCTPEELEEIKKKADMPFKYAKKKEEIKEEEIKEEEIFKLEK